VEIMKKLPLSKLEEVLLNAYLLGETSKEIQVLDIVETIKQQLSEVAVTTEK
jgi:hypothetical protein